MAILVSGGAGYIGSHTCIELLNAGYDVVVADNYYNASPVVLDRVKQITGKDFRFYNADMTRHEDVEKIFSECPDITAVIQFAAYKAVGESTTATTSCSAPPPPFTATPPACPSPRTSPWVPPPTPTAPPRPSLSAS